MAFSSVPFLCAFFPAVVIVYYLLPKIGAKNVFLILASLLFYSYGEGIYVLLMLACIGFNYIAARLIGRFERQKKPILAAAVAVNLGILGFYKYAGMAVLTLNQLTGLHLAAPDIHLPVGISFFTFQALSYVIDVYRKTVKPEKKFTNVLLYISFFPQLIAGPIIKYHDISEQLGKRKAAPEEICRGLRRFIVGMSKKVLIANTMGAAADYVFGLPAGELGMFSAWMGAFAYLFQIYFDFSGYSDMAIGMGRMFGFVFQENFRYPYTAGSMQDFWRRWHISLTGWFREYLYIPLGGNRRGKTRTWINRLIVFFFTGLWHGANWTFVVWGLYHGFFLVLETLLPKPAKKPNRIWRMAGHVYTVLIVCIGFVIFRAESLRQAGQMLSAMFTKTLWTPEIAAAAAALCDKLFLFTLLWAVLCSLPVLGWCRAAKMGPGFRRAWGVLENLSYAASFLLLLACLMSLAGGTYNPFIYFRF